MASLTAKTAALSFSRTFASQRSRQSALITGGASGLGLRVAQELAARGGWHVHIVDRNAEALAAAEHHLSQATSSSSSSSSSSSFTASLHQADITQYSELASAFQNSFTESGGRLDFVFANAGVAGLEPIYEIPETADNGTAPPPAIDLTTVRILYDAAIHSWYLAMHYFRQTKKSVADPKKHLQDEYDPNIVFTASCMGIYAPALNPIYTGCKHGVIGFMRAVAPYSWKQHGVRVNALCPGSFRSGILSSASWSQFPAEAETPMDKVVEGALLLVDGVDTANKAKRIHGPSTEIKDGGMLWGEALEVSGSELFHRDGPPASNSTAEALLEMSSRLDV
ncbi:hypothetical protein SBRCBS47491_008402 [Sporothrix bragantina]|uniref:Short chain dehydrogenase reductase n=1 Tax=Sporothrix bragantina TaxID=671064 RepID=A0ABP0CMP1_9PEZI